MSIVVHALHPNYSSSDEYPDNYLFKVLASGALKVYEPVEFDVPPLGSSTEKEIAEKAQRLVAIYNIPYVVDMDDSLLDDVE